MPRRSRPLIGRNTAASRRYRNAIAIETPLQSETRRALRRLRYSEARVAAAQTMQVPVQRIQLWTHKPFSGLQYNTHIDYKADSSVDIGQMSRVCQFCSALRFRDEPFGLCCKQGRVSLPAIESPPEPIFSLLSGLHPLSKSLLLHIRRYNSIFQMTSFGARQVVTVNMHIFGFCIMPRRGRGRFAYRTRHGNNAPNPISPVPTEYNIGGLDIVCPYCSALHFPGETVGSSCCHKGKVILPTLSSFPYEMMELMTSNSVEAKYFQTNIRSYNSSLAFASMGAQVDVFSGQGPFCYRIHGQIYHLTGPLHPHGNRAPSYAQLYILDSEAANNTRIAASRPLECHPGILTLLDSVLRRVNPYTSAYRQMHQVELAEEHRARIENRQMCQMAMYLLTEILLFFPHDCGLVRISPLNPNCDPMTYPLLFPAGDPGWAIGILHEENMRTSTRNHVTMLQFYSYRLAIRPGFSPIHYGRRLFQQYVVDAYVKTEGNRLNYIRQNQSLLRVELYQGLLDYIHEQEHSRGVRIGRIFILPSSFPGSSRAMQQNYQDAMAIVRKFGRPDLFVTFTCNPRWTDIVENLLPNQNPSDRPDLVARVFNLKLQQLLHEIVSQHVLGVVIARVHVVEFQKRGLPHAHMLFMLREEDKPRDRDAIDMLVCAEIPSPTMQVQLYDMVRKHMIHGPCGNFNLHSPCMSDGKCTKDFPKSFLQLTEANNNGYPRYRRRDDGQTLVVGTHEVDNRWVVPYNPYLLVRFNAHINVEVCASVKSVKYLFKYVYKGHDIAACIKQSKLWPLFVILRLTQNMRAGIDAQSFSQWLLKVGDGDLPTDQQGLISLPESCIFHGVDLVQEIFGSSYGDITALSQSVILTPKNTDSLEINEKVLDRLPNRSQCFLSVDSVECENVEEQNNYPTEFLNSLTPTGMPPHRLNLKIGAIVMLLRNLNPKQGLCNGTRMVIQRMRSHVLEAQILTGTKVGQTVLVPKISLAPSDTNLPFILKRRQFPLRLAFAMTINKAQGQTFARVGLLLHEPVFTHGQLYVAFSRVRTLNSIR
ncbi:hypothetical protein LAZ67_14001932, partial [Cordylochernes scorpioides]